MGGSVVQYDAYWVSPNEKLARIVLSPRDLDPLTNYPKDSFITLRDSEGGISFLRLDYLGKETFCQKGEERASLYNKNLKKPKYMFAGWMEATVDEILSIDPEKIGISVDSPNTRPEHVNVSFKKDGEVVKDIVTDAEILDLMDELYHRLSYIQVYNR